MFERPQHYGSKQPNEWVNCAEFKVQIGVFQWTNADNNYRLHLSSSVAKKKMNERKEALLSYVYCVWAAMSVPKIFGNEKRPHEWQIRNVVLMMHKLFQYTYICV